MRLGANGTPAGIGTDIPDGSFFWVAASVAAETGMRLMRLMEQNPNQP
jgi:hypothetical protein